MIRNKQLLTKMRSLELLTKKLLSSSFMGDRSSAKKGSGLEFQQLADYQFGDDIRFIDWKSSARANKMLVKEYRDERSRTVMLVVDGSKSMQFGSDNQTKQQSVVEMAAVIAYAALYSKDAVGLVLFTDTVELYIPPKVGRAHVDFIIDQLAHHKSNSQDTNIKDALYYVASVLKNDAFVMILSDYIAADLEAKQLALLNKKHDVIALRCLDRYEYALPSIGFIEVQDLETGQAMVLDTHKLLVTKKWYDERMHQQNAFFKKAGVDYVDLEAGENFVEKLILFFKRRIGIKKYV